MSMTTGNCPVVVRLTGGVSTRARGGPKAMPLLSAGCHSLFFSSVASAGTKSGSINHSLGNVIG